ncbi:MAG TPA: cyclopropane-fatty-acyl-phospholipid synthase family protein [Rubrivivax sp.]|nr:cyclopropane-fatty-acyl-phospholipid synthase family protein [Rubrivivax sp.]
MSESSSAAARGFQAGGPLAWPLRRLLTRLLSGISVGSLVVQLPDGQRYDGRGAVPGPHAAVTLHRWRTVARLALQGDIGLAEAYRDGDWSTPDLVALLDFGARNEASWAGTVNPPWPIRLLSRLQHLARGNSRRGSRQNIAFHYDIGNAFYAQWLDPALIYSSALYGDEAQTLEEAQAAKLERVMDLLAIDSSANRTTSVLEIGCGWGALALALAGRHNASVTGLTLSTQQLAFAQQRVAEQCAQAQVNLRLQDYRDVDGTFDRIVSIEMLEAVGERYWPTYFETLRKRLRHGGVAVIQVITIGESHFDNYRSGADFIQRFIFPGGMLPSVSAMQREAGAAGLTLTRELSFGDSYATTLAQWRHRFIEAWPAIEAQGFDLAFKRLWTYYLAYCEAGFRAGRVDVGLFTLRHAVPAESQRHSR